MTSDTMKKRGAARLRIRASRRGFTLIEMLVVVLLVVLISSLMIPVLQSASDVRRAREGARVVSTLLSTAQTQAQVSGRPAALWIQRLKNSSGASINPGAAMELYLAEVPPPYLGDTLSSTASVTSGTVTFNNANLSNANVQAGDLIRFEYRGELYYLNNISAATANITPIDPTQSYPVSANVPFQIYRRPIKTTASAVQLADGVAIDLNYSGVDPNAATSSFNGSFAPAAGSQDVGQIIVTFSPTGAVDLVYIVSSVAQTVVYRPVSGVYFLIGRIENIAPPASQPPNTIPNWQDYNARWVAAGRQSGLITTAEAASPQSGATASMITSLRLARSSQNTGGN